MYSDLPIIDAEFEDIPTSNDKFNKTTKQPRNTSNKSAKVHLVDSTICYNKQKARNKKTNPKKTTSKVDYTGRLDILAEGIIQEETNNPYLARLVGSFIGVTVGKKVKGPEFDFLSNLLKGTF